MSCEVMEVFEPSHTACGNGQGIDSQNILMFAEDWTREGKSEENEE